MREHPAAVCPHGDTWVVCGKVPEGRGMWEYPEAVCPHGDTWAVCGKCAAA